MSRPNKVRKKPAECHPVEPTMATTDAGGSLERKLREFFASLGMTATTEVAATSDCRPRIPGESPRLIEYTENVGAGPKAWPWHSRESDWVSPEPLP